jgi:hypothetical protein
MQELLLRAAGRVPVASAAEAEAARSGSGADV